MTKASPVRVLQVVGSMNRGGTETWLMHVLRGIDRREFNFTFLMFTDTPSAYDEEILSLGGEIERIPSPRHIHRFAPRLAALLRKGQYDVVHSHIHFSTGTVLPIAMAAGIRARIAHGHTDTREPDAHASPARRAYASTMKSSIRTFMTHGVAVSEAAAMCLFGTQFESDRRVRILHCGIDMKPFSAPLDKMAVRKELGIPSNARVIGHVGRMEAVKNHTFVLKLAEQVMRNEPNAWLLLVGDGTLRDHIEKQIDDLAIRERTIVTGNRADVPRLMSGAMDVFLLPSLVEGLPLTVMEAQATELPSIVSNAVPVEAIVRSDLITRLPLSHPESSWTKALLRCLTQAPAHSPQLASNFQRSSFNVETSLRQLSHLYQTSRRSEAA